MIDKSQCHLHIKYVGGASICGHFESGIFKQQQTKYLLNQNSRHTSALTKIEHSTRNQKEKKHEK